MYFITTFGKASPLVHSPPPPLFCIHFFSSTTTNMVVESAESSGKREPERKHSPWLFQHLPLLKRARGKIFNNHLKKAFFVGAEFIWQPTTRDGPMSFLVECWGEWVKGLEYPVTEFFFFWWATLPVGPPKHGFARWVSKRLCVSKYTPHQTHLRMREKAKNRQLGGETKQCWLPKRR